MMRSSVKLVLVNTLAIVMSACTTINVDHVRIKETPALKKGDAMVVLGRHQTAEIQTEASLVSCIGNRLARGTGDVRIIPEAEFVDAFYPWFEARTAPLHPKKLRKVLNQPAVAKKIENLNIRYFVWVEGSTERTNSAGSMTCSIGPGGGGCFGFGSWEDTSNYETTIWDLETFSEVGRVSTEAVGTSYMPAFVIPIPLLAQVEGDACQGMGNQLVRFFTKDSQALKTNP
ncbi:MAG: hypothetical protein JKX81_03455 [Arenicella sp.]|nr:hypothetical protein [Arenicella sp.]